MLVQLLVSLGVVVASLAAPANEAEPEAKGEIWAVLVAGSLTYTNYRHQADVCHAYQIFHRHGISDSNIIVMMYDDIADNYDNPRQGVIINKPNGPNVYGPKAVPKDYTRFDVTPQNFINVLTGNQKAMLGKGSGKVLKSGPNDHVFINFVGHGSTGFVNFPNDMMFAHDLLQALKTMHMKKMYKKLVFYMDADYSGSMFYQFVPTNLNILATTATNLDEPSYACYWDSTVKAYLGNEFSVSWMEDIDSEEHFKNQTTETLLTQFNNVVSRVADSHPSMNGKKSIDKDKVMDYFGASKKTVTHRSEASSSLERFTDAVSNQDVALHTLLIQIEKTDDVEKKSKLTKEKDALIADRRSVDELFSRALRRMNSVDQKTVVGSRQPVTIDMMPCYKTVVNFFTNHCVNINKNTYALAHLYKLANLCSLSVSPDDVIKVFSEECSDEHRAMIGVN